MNGLKLQKHAKRKDCPQDMDSRLTHNPKNALHGTEDPILKKQELNSVVKEIKYGELVILGHNGFLPGLNRGRRQSKYALYKRDIPNGVKNSKHYVVSTPHPSKVILDSQQHAITYSMSKNQATIVEYRNDEKTDMFQIGRSSESPIDFVVLDVVPGNLDAGKEMVKSTISRFACRILADRTNPKIVRIYAAGFDASHNIFLGEEATKWQNANGVADGLTTNGVLICHAQGNFSGGEAKPGSWREVSVGGGIYSLRPSRSARVKGELFEGEDNVLQDGTLIDLCGATLLWRSSEGLKNSPTKQDVEMLVDQLNEGKPVCPVGLNTLVIPRKLTDPAETISDAQQPFVYLKCGHVQGSHNWGVLKNRSRCCPLCWKEGPVVRLCMGMEPAFYVDFGSPTFAFNPCGHMASEKTVKYWADVPIPHGTNDCQSVCPFCLTPLDGWPGYVRLIFQEFVE